MNTTTPETGIGPEGHFQDPAAQIKISVRSVEQLEMMYRRGLATGQMFIPTQRRLPVGTALDLFVSMRDDVSITVSAHVVADARESTRPGRCGLLVEFDPMSQTEFDAISSLLRETAAVRRPRMAAGTDPCLAIVPRETETFTQEQRQIVQRELELARGFDALSEGQLDEATTRFEAVLARDPGCADAARGLTEVAARRRDAMRGRLDQLLGRR